MRSYHTGDTGPGIPGIPRNRSDPRAEGRVGPEVEEVVSEEPKGNTEVVCLKLSAMGRRDPSR
jgi:hypothetical protein